MPRLWNHTREFEPDRAVHRDIRQWRRLLGDASMKDRSRLVGSSSGWTLL
jgi:hypothetical protein